VTNLTLLGVFKYLDFLIESWNLVSLRFTDSLDVGTLGLALPVGISFYTFQTMSYTIDIYRKKQSPYDSFLDFACYAAFFPQLVAGPIVRADHFREQIKEPLAPSAYRFRLGLTLIIYGIAKKLVIADNVAVHANEVFVEGEHLANIGLIWWATLCFGIQIYCDFSAYTDIAIGSAHLIGVELPENFKTPYAATSPQDFWRRWHISLSTWLARLSLHPTWRFKKRSESHDLRAHDDHASRRFVARGLVELRPVGFGSRLVAHHSSVWKRNLIREAFL
jgi:D-alanyl-lipoteichoic acid acyltransferase DltB (MBOAT superfamily)